MEEKGLSLTFVLMNMFFKNVVDAIDIYKKKLELNLNNIVIKEQWHSNKQWPADSGIFIFKFIFYILFLCIFFTILFQYFYL